MPRVEKNDSTYASAVVCRMRTPKPIIENSV